MTDSKRSVIKFDLYWDVPETRHFQQASAKLTLVLKRLAKGGI
jgi:hypothetical protein